MSGKTAFAALTLSLVTSGGKVPAEAHILPPGSFRTDDGSGRPRDVKAWRLDAATAARLGEKIQSSPKDTVIDYEHQTLFKTLNGQPAPAAGWFRNLEYRDTGLYATGIKWTDRAAALIAAGEYRYTSAVFSYNGETGEIENISSFALTNDPALNNLEALVAALTAQNSINSNSNSNFKTTGDNPMPDDKKDSAIAALTAERDSQKTVIAALTAERDALKQKADALEKEKAEIEAAREKIEREALIEAALSANKMLPAHKEFAGTLSIEQLKSFIASQEGVASLTRQTDGSRPDVADKENPHGLTEQEVALCRDANIGHEFYAAAKKAQAALQKSGVPAKD